MKAFLLPLLIYSAPGFVLMLRDWLEYRGWLALIYIYIWLIGLHLLLRQFL